MSTLQASPRKLSCLIVLIFIFSGLTAAQAQSGQYSNSVQVGNGTLSWMGYRFTSACVNGSQVEYGWSWTFENFTYTPTGSSTITLSTQDGGEYGLTALCSSGPMPAVIPLVLPANPSGITLICAVPESSGNISASTTGCTAPVTSSQGVIYPKYVVVGVTYAPPGAGSSVQYTGTTSIGTTSTYSDAISNDANFSIKVSGGGGLFGVANGGVTITSTSDLTQTQNNSSSVTLSKSTSTAYKTAGYATTSASVVANEHDYDVIQLWLNPALLFTASPATSSTPASIQWNGYGYDTADINGPDVYPIEVGCLNGDFTAAYCATQQGVLNRAWATGLYASPTTNAIVSPAVLPNTQDAYNLLNADPLAYNPGGSTYTLLNSSPLPITTSDGRYTQYLYPPNPVIYEPGETEAYTVTQQNTQTDSQGGSTKLEEKISVSVKASSGFLNLWDASTTYTASDTISYTNTWLTSLTTTQTVADAFTVAGSNPPNYVPGEFIVYQDNQMGTFMFYPSN